jgi:hypothetical protein
LQHVALAQSCWRSIKGSITYNWMFTDLISIATKRYTPFSGTAGDSTPVMAKNDKSGYHLRDNSHIPCGPVRHCQCNVVAGVK